MKHPKLPKLIHKLRIEQSSTEMTLEQASAGVDVGRETLKYIRLKERLKKVVLNYDAEYGLQFLRACAHNCM